MTALTVTPLAAARRSPRPLAVEVEAGYHDVSRRSRLLVACELGWARRGRT